ncbi:hypothetical protein CRYUN_Cryun09bG0047900 [Craigia yunnanensis]
MHCLALKFGLGFDIFVGSNLVDMYSKCGVMINAYKVFQEMRCKDEVLWTALIDGYAKNGLFEDALLTYKSVVNEGIAIDKFVLCSTLSACAALKVLNFGKCLHSVMVKKGFELEISVGNALTDMYSKVGDVDSASNVFGIDSECRNIVSCSSLIDGYIEMDRMEDALSVFIELRRRGIESNEFTFSSLIKACASQAALEQGTQLHAQVIKFNFDGNPFVSSVLVDMYGKCGLLDDSLRLFDEIENATQIAWNSMLSEQQWEDVRTLRKMMQDGNVKKLPGYSWVDVGNKTHIFGVEDWSHLQKKAIYEKLNAISDQIKKAGYVPCTDSIPLDMDVSVKEKMLQHHRVKHLTLDFWSMQDNK